MIKNVLWQSRPQLDEGEENEKNSVRENRSVGFTSWAWRNPFDQTLGGGFYQDRSSCPGAGNKFF